MIFVDISHNWIAELPEQISKLTELQFFDCSHNRLVRLTPSIGQLTKLLDLFLQSNRLLFIPEEMTRLNRLRFTQQSFYPLTFRVLHPYARQ